MGELPVLIDLKNTIANGHAPTAPQVLIRNGGTCALLVPVSDLVLSLPSDGFFWVIFNVP